MTNDYHKKDYDLSGVQQGDIVFVEDIYSDSAKKLIFFEVEKIKPTPKARYKRVILALLNSRSIEHKQTPVLEDKMQIVYGHLDMVTKFLTVRFDGMISAVRKYQGDK